MKKHSSILIVILNLCVVSLLFVSYSIMKKYAFLLPDNFMSLTKWEDTTIVIHFMNQFRFLYIFIFLIILFILIFLSYKISKNIFIKISLGIVFVGLILSCYFLVGCRFNEEYVIWAIAINLLKVLTFHGGIYSVLFYSMFAYSLIYLDFQRLKDIFRTK